MRGFSRRRVAPMRCGQRSSSRCGGRRTARLHDLSFASFTVAVAGACHLRRVKNAELGAELAEIFKPAVGFSFQIAVAKLRLRSARGLRTMLASQQNAWIHAGATCVVVAAGFMAGLGRFEWLALVSAIVSVWTAESLNTAFESLCDVASPEFHPLVARAKDVAAAAVLICAGAGALLTAADRVCAACRERAALS